MKRNFFICLSLFTLAVALNFVSLDHSVKSQTPPAKTASPTPTVYFAHIKDKPITQRELQPLLTKALKHVKPALVFDAEVEAITSRMADSPALVVPSLAPYVNHSKEEIRSLVADICSRAIAREETLQVDAASDRWKTLALRFLLTIMARGGDFAAPIAVNAFFTAALTPSKRAVLQTQWITPLQKALGSYLSHSYKDEAALLLSLAPPNAQTAAFLDRVAARENYPLATSVTRSNWGDGNALEAIQSAIKNGQPKDIEFLSRNVLFIDNPQVLGIFVSHLDDKRPVANVSPIHDQELYASIGDFLLGALQFKLDHTHVLLDWPEIATNAQLAAAKTKYQQIIDAVPVPTPPQD